MSERPCDCPTNGAPVRVEVSGPSTLRFWHLSASLASGQHTFRVAGVEIPARPDQLGDPPTP